MIIKHYFIALLLFLTISPLHAEIEFTKVINEIRVTGNTRIKDSQLALHTLQNKIDQKISPQRLQHDIQTLYLTGNFNKVSAQTIPSYNRVILEFIVKENPIISKIQIQGNTLYSDKKLLKELKLEPGHTLNLNTLDSDKETLTNFFIQKGYILFTLQEVTFEKGVLTYHISEGYVNKVSFVGLKKIKKRILTRMMRQKNGSPFNDIALRKDREELLKLGYFSDISSPQLSEAKNGKAIDIQFTVKEKKTNRIDIGLEQEEEQFVGFFRGIHNHTLLHSDILTGKVQVGNDDKALAIKSYTARYHQPWILNKLPVSLTLGAWTELNEEIKANQATTSEKDLESTQRVGGNIMFGFPLIQDTFNFFLTYKNERVSPRKNSTFNTYKLDSISGRLSYQTISNPFNPKKGLYWHAEYEHGEDVGFIKFNGIRFKRATLRGATFIPLSKTTTWATHGSAGIFSSSSNSDSFEIESFIIGGSNSVRGYNEADYPFSGTRKLVFNQELRMDFNEKFQWVLFFDAGKTFNHGLTATLKELNTGYGIGIRFITPVGPLRFDLAQGEESIYLHFGIGQLF